jgi:hypothetical protein
MQGFELRQATHTWSKDKHGQAQSSAKPAARMTGRLQDASCINNAKIL